MLTQRNISASSSPARTATSLALKTAIDKLVEKIVKVETEVNGEITAQEKPKKTKAPSSNSKDAAACEYARQKDSSITWKTYIDKYPNGECAEEAFQKFEGDINQEAALYSKADQKLEGTFSGRWNLGLGPTWFYDPDLHSSAGIAFSTGFDFNFKVFSKPYGVGAGNLFIGFGFDLVYYIPEELILPIMANFAYEFKTSNKIFRYVSILLKTEGCSLRQDSMPSLLQKHRHVNRQTGSFAVFF